MSAEDAVTVDAAPVKLRLLQFNTLGKHLAETVQFPYAIDVDRERMVESRIARYESWDTYGIQEGHWLRKGLPEGSTPAGYLLGQNEKGTFGVEESEGKLIYAWEERLPQLVNQIGRHCPDIIFLQEIELGTLADFARNLGARISMPYSPETPTVTPDDPRFPHTFDGVYVPREEKPTSDGAALLWRVDALEVAQDVTSEVLRYSDSAKKVALLQGLRLKQTNATFLAVTTHLHWNPAAPLQKGEAAELIEKLNGMPRRWPVILGGDLNCGLANAAYTQLPEAGFKDIDGWLSPAEQRRFTMHVPRANVPKVTDARRWEDAAWTELNPVISDYILVRDVPLRSVQVLDTGLQGDEGFVPSDTNGLPNKSWSASDHFPIAYEIELCLPSCT